MGERAQKVKAHVQRNKTFYIGVAVGVAIATTVTVIILKRGDVIAIESEECTVINKAENVTFIKTFQENRGRPGNLVRCIETNKTYPSQHRAAALMGLSESNLSQHLNGKYADADGFHFVWVAEAA